jgi:UDP-N-acetylglucosamine 1-carboxyvinyltransferase
MDKLLITGGKRLAGDIAISGAKNAALPILCASLLSADTVYLSNVPKLQDVATMLRLLRQMGLRAEEDGERIALNGGRIDKLEAPYEMVKTMRAAILVLGPLLARFGEAWVSLPGGCAIGTRPVDQHIKGLRAMGADIRIEAGYIHAKAKRLKGARIVTDMITVTGTENLLMAATLADGETVLENAAREPEVTDLANLLAAMGAQISGIGTDRLVVQGVERLHGASHSVIPDRIETATFLCAVAAAGGDVTVTNVRTDILDVALDKLVDSGAEVSTDEDGFTVEVGKRLASFDVVTLPYPGFPTDLQPFAMALASVSEGTAMITENVFESRFMFAQELARLGADLHTDGHHAVVRGVPLLSGAPVVAHDIRAGAALVLAGLAAQGVTTVAESHHIDRGYPRFAEVLASIGADVVRVPDPAA